MEPLIEQIITAFPDIEPADIQRVMSWLGYTTQDIYEPNPSYREVNGITFFIQSPIVNDDIDMSNHFNDPS